MREEELFCYVDLECDPEQYGWVVRQAKITSKNSHFKGSFVMQDTLCFYRLYDSEEEAILRFSVEHPEMKLFKIRWREHPSKYVCDSASAFEKFFEEA